MRLWAMVLFLFVINCLCNAFTIMDPFGTGYAIASDTDLINMSGDVSSVNSTTFLDLAGEAIALGNFAVNVFWRSTFGVGQMITNFGITGVWNLTLSSLCWLCYGVGLFQLVFNRGMKNNE